MSSHTPRTLMPAPLTTADRVAFDRLHARVPRPTIDLFERTFDLLEASLDDWASALRRVRRVRRYLAFHIRGARPDIDLTVDLWFTATLAARVLDADVGLTAAEMIALFDAVGLPTEAVPQFAQPSPRTPLADELARAAAAHAADAHAALGPELDETDDADDELADAA